VKELLRMEFIYGYVPKVSLLHRLYVSLMIPWKDPPVFLLPVLGKEPENYINCNGLKLEEETQ